MYFVEVNEYFFSMQKRKRGKTMNVKEKIIALRKLMERENIDAWIVPSSDPHQSEYVAECWRARD